VKPSNIVNFLDIKIIKDETNKIKTDIFYKSTNNFNYIPFNSPHQQKVKLIFLTIYLKE